MTCGPRWVLAAVLLAVGLQFAACQGRPDNALKLTEESLRQRATQTRRFESPDEKFILAACAAALQDLGFGVEESLPELGLISADKDRDAKELRQVVFAVLVTILSLGTPPPIDSRQNIRAIVVTRPIGENGGWISVRVLFQRTVWNDRGAVSKRENIDDAHIYQEFFERLSKAVFLEAHAL